MGHADAIIAGGRGTAAEKMKALAAAGATLVTSPADMGRPRPRLSGGEREHGGANAAHHPSRTRWARAWSARSSRVSSGRASPSWPPSCSTCRRPRRAASTPSTASGLLREPLRVQVLAMALEGENAIARWRELMGATDPAKASPGTVRKDYASSIEANAVHGSDSPESATFEIAYFFNALELVSALATRCPRAEGWSRRPSARARTAPPSTELRPWRASPA